MHPRAERRELRGEREHLGRYATPHTLCARITFVITTASSEQTPHHIARDTGNGWRVSVQDNGEFGDVSTDFWFEDKKEASTFKKSVFDFLLKHHSNWDNLDQMVDAPKFKAIGPDW